MSAARIGVEIAADETELQNAAAQLRDRTGQRGARKLRQLTDADEVLREELHHPRNQVVVELRPGDGNLFVPQMVSHGRGARRKQSQIAAALALQAQLLRLDTGADRLIADARQLRV